MAARRYAGQPLRVPFHEFGWDPGRRAALEHSTLPWFEVSEAEKSFDGRTLDHAARLGSRDRLSLLGQFAAHCAFLRFAGVSAGEFQPGDWIFTRDRGSDPRLIRVHATDTNGFGEIPPVSLIESFGASIKVQSLDVFRHSWAKPESAYLEIERRLAEDVRASRAWFRRAAGGWVFSPGADGLEALSRGRGTVLYCDADAVTSIARLETKEIRTIVFAGFSPLEKYSALRALGTISTERSEAEVAESLAESFDKAIAVVSRPDAFDESSRRVVQGLMRAASGWSWVLPSEVTSWVPAGTLLEEASPSLLFVVAPRVTAADAMRHEVAQLPSAARQQWLVEFLSGSGYAEFLAQGTMPASRSVVIDQIREPRRSYLAALASLGPRFSVELAIELLTEVGSNLNLAEVIESSVVSVEHEWIFFHDENVRRSLVMGLSPDSRRSVAAVTALLLEKYGDPVAAAARCHEAGMPERAVELLGKIDWSTRSDGIAVLSGFPAALIRRSEPLTEAYASALIDAGRYVDAKPFAETATGGRRGLLEARIERRLGNYAAALERLSGVDSCAARIQRAELLRLQGKFDDAGAELRRADARSTADRARLDYERAILACDSDSEMPDLTSLQIDAYLTARWETYRAIAAGDPAGAVTFSGGAFQAAKTIPDRIDAALDLVFACFLSGDWRAARHEARAALALVEESQGDRAAGGILFTLAFLCADAGSWIEAEHAIQRLTAFYTTMQDDRRVGELRMLRAHLALCRGRFSEARRHLGSVVDPRWSAEIREAANLILDEVDWIDGQLQLVRTTGATPCRELTRRHEFHQSRATGRMDSERLDPFSQQVLQFEAEVLRGESPATPEVVSHTERLRLYRSLVGLTRRTSREELDVRARELAAALGIDHRSLDREDGLFTCELQLLQLLSAGRFPFGPSDLAEFRWRFASRNRIGTWNQSGSLPPLPDSELAKITEELPPDWLACTDSSFVYIDGLSRFGPKSRDAVRSLFALQSDHFRLRRATEQEEFRVADHLDGSTAGILGNSAAIRDVTGMIDRLARRDVAICILGESGTGKELFARAIHFRSARRHKPFTAINCAALPENLVESEMFGHIRGAFTGADRDRAGLIEASDGGTLFLDEIGELPMPAQAKLLRFLQDGEYRRLGDTAIRRADVRVVAATNRRLDEAVDSEEFREDLYYRIRGMELAIPPLRERGADILLLANHFLAAEREKHRAGPSRFSDDAEAILASYSWPGNVRELQNTVRAAHALAGEATVIEVDHLPQRLQSVLIVRGPRGTYHDELIRFRRGLIEKSLLEAGGNQNKAAKSLGMTRQALAYQIRELGLMLKGHA